MTGEVALTIDATGQVCPQPVLELARRVGEVPVGATIGLLTDDPAAAADVSAWCRMRDHELVSAEPAGAATRFVVRRRH